MGVLESGPQAIDWWIPGLRELNGILLGVWLAVVLLLAVVGVVVMLRMRRARRSGEIGPQAYRWRSENRFRFYGLVAAVGFMIVPGFFYVIVFLGVLFGSMLATDSTAWNLTAFVVLAFWAISFGWLARHVRNGHKLPPEPPVHDEPGALPFFLRLPGEDGQGARGS